MDEAKTAVAAALIALIGVMLLYYFSQNTGATPMKIGELSYKNIGEKIEANGIIASAKMSGKTCMMDFCESKANDSACISVVSFDKDYTQQAGYGAQVTGEVQLYKGNLEIVADKVIVEAVK
ncbi:Uncharacterised protein [Candidatus Gugararchaeum adminiculabundum]|nr:Uncharacterised protein [Candidatus Gugararchaeum adminiculabundum]